MEHDGIPQHRDLNAVELYLLRSDFLDACANLEAAVCRILRSCGDARSTEPFGHRVQAFRKAEKTNLIAKANFGQRDQIADAIAELLPVRADIVHSAMKISLLDGQTTALFTNARTASDDYPVVRLLKAQDFRELIRRVANLTARTGTLGRVSPASSPPPPSPDAAGGP